MAKMKIIQCFLLMVAILIGLQETNAQALSYLQYYNAPLLVNPANTGFNPDYDYRAGLNYRNSWSAIGAGYKTMGVWADSKLFANRFENGWMGIGATINKDVAGAGQLTATGAALSLAWHQMLGYNSLLSAGFSAGITAKRVDISKLNFDNQWNGQFFDVSIPSNEPFAFSQVGYLDVNMGLNYAYFASENFYFNAGVSLMHLNRPKESFFASTISDARVPIRYNVFANASIKMEDLWIINPNIYFSSVGNTSELVMGLNANRNLGGNGQQQMILGLYYRNSDAIIPMVGYQINDLKITVNYDATISSVNRFNASRGAYELSIIKHGIFSSSLGRSVKCPTVRF
jgi:type IX secretion system PorP/SprF family membrane protein